MPDFANQARTLRVTVAGLPYEVSVGRCQMSALDTGEHLVGPDGATLFEVWTRCSDHERGWLMVRDLSMTDDQSAALLAAPGAVEPGSDPRDGFFHYPADTFMDRVLSGRPG
jgi:hypothetical protein